MFSGDILQLFKNTYFEDHLRTAASIKTSETVKDKKCF